MKEKSHKKGGKTNAESCEGDVLKQNAEGIRNEDVVVVKNEDVLLSFDDALKKIMEYKK